MSKINSGDQVRVHYEGRLEDGTVFDSSAEREPLEFEAGSDQLIPGFSHAVVGMEMGEKKTVTLPPEDAYGDARPEMMQRVPTAELPEGVKVGDQLVAHAGEQTIPVKVTEMNADEAVLDANHPLAGKTLIFDIEIVA
jgi:FKBP-type peptidyl-prolyl cis-trans isomerase 2